MSDPRLHAQALPRPNEPLRHAARRLRWFRRAFKDYVHEMEQVLGLRFALDETLLADIFVAWLRSVERQDPDPPAGDTAARRAYYDLSASLMLRELLAQPPLRALEAPRHAKAGSPAAFWPEAYVCALFCLAVRSLVLAQEFGDTPPPSAEALDDLRGWWSLRENAARNPAFAAGFLQYLMGNSPNWTKPDSFRAGMALSGG